jgi:O-antigen/teichoic acid export membrane protein
MASRAGSAARTAGRVLNILVLRGLGSAVSVVLTLVVVRFFAPVESARFLLVLSITTIAAVCFRWGLDDVIVRRAAALGDREDQRLAAGRLLALSHRRVGWWALVGLTVAVAAVLLTTQVGVGLTPTDVIASVVISAAIALAACGGRLYQGVGRTNLAAVVLNILIPGLTLVVVLILGLIGIAGIAAWSLIAYGGAALVAYTVTVWIFPVGRPRLVGHGEGRAESAADRHAADRLGGVVLAQQILNWTALLLVPFTYGPLIYTSFVVDFRVANLVSLVMLAINFTFASRLAGLFAQGEHLAIRRLGRQMVIAVVVLSVVAGGILVLLAAPIHEFSGVPTQHPWLLTILAVGQLFFAVSAVQSLQLTMTHDERYLLRAQGLVTGSGVVLFVVLSLTTSIEVASLAFIVAYVALSIVLGNRVRALNHARAASITAGAGVAWARYERIQAFKRSPAVTFDGINYARVVASYLYDDSLGGALRKLVFAVMFAPRLGREGTSAATAIFYSHRSKHRDDYDYIVAELRAAAGAEHDYFELSERLSPIQWWRTLRSLPSGLAAAKAFEGRRASKLGAAVLIAKYKSVTAELDRSVVSTHRTVATFCDALAHDNLVAQLAVRAGARTVTAQHGQYRILDEMSMSSDAEAYANFVSDRMLVWGESTISELSRFGIDRNRLLVTGWIRQWPSRGVSVRRGVFGVMLNGANGAESNLMLLESAAQLADRLDLRYVVRTHPSFDEKSYRGVVSDRCDAVKPMSSGDYLDQIDFSLCHASSAGIEMLLLGSPLYVVDDGRLPPGLSESGLTVRDVDELELAVLADRAGSDHGLDRFVANSRWFNDSVDQRARVRAALVAEEG